MKDAIGRHLQNRSPNPHARTERLNGRLDCRLAKKKIAGIEVPHQGTVLDLLQTPIHAVIDAAVRATQDRAGALPTTADGSDRIDGVRWTTVHHHMNSRWVRLATHGCPCPFETD